MSDYTTMLGKMMTQDKSKDSADSDPNLHKELPAPKLAPRSDKMEEVLAELLSSSLSKINSPMD